MLESKTRTAAQTRPCPDTDRLSPPLSEVESKLAMATGSGYGHENYGGPLSCFVVYRLLCSTLVRLHAIFAAWVRLPPPPAFLFLFLGTCSPLGSRAPPAMSSRSSTSTG